MSRFKKLSQTIWYCQYHIVWVPKYRFRVLIDNVVREVEKCIRIFSEQQECEVKELNVQVDHVHLLVLVPPKVSISGYVGAVRERLNLAPSGGKAFYPLLGVSPKQGPLGSDFYRLLIQRS